MNKIFVEGYGHVYGLGKQYVERVLSQVQDYFNETTHVQPGDVVFDIGANIGLFALEVVKRTKGNCHLYCFEPIPDTYEMLNKNIDEMKKTLGTDKTKVNTFNFGLSNKDSSILFHHHPNSPATSTYSAIGRQAADDVLNAYGRVVFGNTDISKRYRTMLTAETEVLSESEFRSLFDIEVKKRQITERIECRLCKLHDMVIKSKIEKIDLLKIDVEGAEMDVLEGLEEDDWCKISKMVIEVHDVNSRLNKTKELLVNKGFTLGIRREVLFIDLNVPIFTVAANRLETTKKTINVN